MPYLNLDPNYHEHPKTRRLIALLGDLADIYPIRLWSYCARFHPYDGRMRGYSPEEIEGILGWKGTPKVLVASLAKVGFILASKSGFSCVDWHQHEGHLEAFSRRGTIAARARWDRYASSMPKALQEACKSNAPAVPTIPTIPTKEEVYAYCLERKNGVDPDRWFDFYSAKGWMIGKNKMRNWKAAVRTWEKNQNDNNNGRIAGATTPKRSEKYEHLSIRGDAEPKGKTGGDGPDEVELPSS